MQTDYLRYIIEIDRTRSITQAAANLYLSQPNLSRTLMEVEERLGFAVFRRTSRGVQPTEQGEAFLAHARRIVAELDAIEGLGAGRRDADCFRVCMPRSAGILEFAVEYLKSLPEGEGLDAVLRECHVRQAFECLRAGEVDLGVIRFRDQYQGYFEDQAAREGLAFEPLNSYRYQVVMRADNPVAGRPSLRVADLAGLTEITHGDTFRERRPQDTPCRRHVYSVDRLAQLTLLSRLPGAFMWMPGLRPEVLAAWGLAQRDVEDNDIAYRNALVCVKPERLSAIEQGFLDWLRKEYKA